MTLEQLIVEVKQQYRDGELNYIDAVMALEELTTSLEAEKIVDGWVAEK